jgi:hypothetical protein
LLLRAAKKEIISAACPEQSFVFFMLLHNSEKKVRNIWIIDKIKIAGCSFTTLVKNFLDKQKHFGLLSTNRFNLFQTFEVNHYARNKWKRKSRFPTNA